LLFESISPPDENVLFRDMNILHEKMSLNVPGHIGIVFVDFNTSGVEIHDNSSESIVREVRPHDCCVGFGDVAHPNLLSTQIEFVTTRYRFTPLQRDSMRIPLKSLEREARHGVTKVDL
jgi:hypothetical protein